MKMQEMERPEQGADWKRQVQQVVLAYRRLPPKKKARVDKLFELLEKSDDLAEQNEIALAVAEILLPESVEMTGCAGRVVNMEEGVSDETKRRVDAYRKHVGAAIRKRRGELQMTQAELAAKAGLPQSHISRLEDGQHAPTAKTIERLARALNTEPSQLDILYD
ncbi:MAG TPA: helix-turn-helix transcriptional regulator [Gemmataceae bacterium]|nr:helix-turn-helix transcriptional regulator [Gemmataceae bacterium]